MKKIKKESEKNFKNVLEPDVMEAFSELRLLPSDDSSLFQADTKLASTPGY